VYRKLFHCGIEPSSLARMVVWHTAACRKCRIRHAILERERLLAAGAGHVVEEGLGRVQDWLLKCGAGIPVEPVLLIMARPRI